MYSRSALYSRLCLSRNARNIIKEQVLTRHPARIPRTLTAHPLEPGSCSSRRWQNTDAAQQGFVVPNPFKTHSEEHQLSLEDELLAIQDTAVAEFEATLGKSLEQAIQENTLPDGYEHSSSELTTEPSVPKDVVEAAQSPLRALRDNGASTEAIVREARQVFGDSLPDDMLTEDERMIYVRNYGEPRGYTSDLLDGEDIDINQIPDDVLFNADGAEVAYTLESSEEITEQILGYRTSAHSESANEVTQHSSPEGSLASISTGMLDSPMTRAQDVARSLGGDVVDDEDLHAAEDIDEDIDEDTDDRLDSRAHPLTKMGKFATSPRTIFLPQAGFVQHATKIMSDFSNKHLKEMCEKTFGGPGLPNSPLTPRSARSRPQVPIPLDVSHHTMGQMEANAFVTAVMPPTYASILSVLVETRKRLGSSWLSKLLARPAGPRVLDAGSGGAGIVAWREIIDANWKSLHTLDQNTPPPPPSKAVVLTGSDTIRHRAATMLENTTFIPRLPDYVNIRHKPTLEDARSPQPRKQFDVIIASHSLFGLKEEWERRQHVQNLWAMLSDEGGVLVFIEKGIPRGFEAIAGARELLLERYIAVPEGHATHYSMQGQADFVDNDSAYQKVPGMIVAPCTNHSKCPLYRTPGLAKGRKDVCSFEQRYVRPPFLQRVLGARDRNHDDVDFSYLAVMKGDDLRLRTFDTWEHLNDPLSAPTGQAQAMKEQLSRLDVERGYEDLKPTSTPSSASLPPAHTLPRLIMAPLKRRGHVTLDVCTPKATIERWTIPKSFSKQAYHDARKARWGDLWALGAKTIVPRNLRLGFPERELAGKSVSGQKLTGSEKKAIGRKGRLAMRAKDALREELEEEDKELQEEREFRRLLEEDNLLDEDDEDGMIDMDTLLPKSVRQAPSTTSKSASSPVPPHGEQPSTKRTQRTRGNPSERFGSYAKDSEMHAWGAELESSFTGHNSRSRSGKAGHSKQMRATKE